MNKRKDKSAAGPSMAQIWLFTGLAVTVILVLAIGVSMVVRGNQSAQTTVAEIPAPAPAAAISAEQSRQVTAEALVSAPAEHVESKADVAEDTAEAPLVPVKPKHAVETRPVLQLDKLAGTLSVETPAALPGKRLDLEYTCYRSGISLPVKWQGAPSGTKSLVLVMEEYQTGEQPFVKWLVYNLPASSKGLPAGLAAAEAFEGGIMQGRSDNGTAGYNGPCIPQGMVKYALRLFALDTVLTPHTKVKFEDLIPAMNGHIIDMAEYSFQHYLNL